MTNVTDPTTISVSNDMVEKLELILKALGDKNRLRIINMLTRKPMCVCEINGVLPLSQSTVSGHLRVLKDTGLVKDTKSGLWVEYHLNEDHPLIGDILKMITAMLEKDKTMVKERELAIQQDRTKICSSKENHE